MDLNVYQTIFALFYAIMWGGLTNVWPRWRAFDWSLGAVDPEERPIRRCLLAIAVLNLVPIIFFIIVLFVLHYWRFDEWRWLTGIKVFTVMLQPFALIGFYWIWVSVVQRWRRTFYPGWLDRNDRYRNLSEEDLDRRRASTSFCVGCFYVLIPVAVLGLVSLLAPPPP